MTVSTTVNKAFFDGSGSTGPFTFNFRFFTNTDIYVVKTVDGVDTTLDESTDYTLTGANSYSGGSVTLTTALAVGEKLTIYRTLPISQLTDLRNQGAFFAETHEDVFDRLTMVDQQQKESIERALKVSVSTPDGVSSELPPPVANQVIGWDNTGAGLKNWDVNDLVTSVAYGNAKSFIDTGDGSTVDFYLEDDPANINNLDVSVGGVCQVPGTDYTWSSGKKVTFTTAPPNGETILIRYMQALPLGTIGWDLVYDTPFTDSTVYINSTTSASAAGYTAINILKGGELVVASGVTFTIDVPFTAVNNQVFSGDGTVKFSAGSVDKVNPIWFGAVGDGITDCYDAISNALESITSGGTIYLPSGIYGVSQSIVVGDGSNSAQSTKHHGITIVGEGLCSSDDISNTELTSGTTLKWIGSSAISSSVINFAGPLHTVGLSNISIDCDDLAGIGVTVNHVCHSQFDRVYVKNYSSVGWNLTSRSDFPTGVAYGNADNRFIGCYAQSPSNKSATAISLTSGVDSGTALAGKPDTARCIFIGGSFTYGGDTSSYGAYLNGADNNQFIGCLFFPSSGSSGGYDIYFQQWASSGDFPKENVFSNCGMTRGVSGNSGVGPTGGNFFYPFQTGDGASVPSIQSAQSVCFDGKTYVNGVRAYRGRQIETYSSQTPQSRSSATYGDVTGYSIDFDTVASSKLKITFTGSAAKATAGNGFYLLSVNGSDYSETISRIGATGYYGTVSCSLLVDVDAGTQTVKVRFKSDDTNATTLNNGVLIVEELY